MFFSARLDTNPSALRETLSARSMNVLVPCDSLKRRIEQKDVSAFLELLESEIPGGIEAIPYSCDRDLGGVLDKDVLSKTFQTQLPLFKEAMK